MPDTLATPRPVRASVSQLLRRTLLLRCPHCGRGRLFRKFFQMNEQCGACSYDFRREPGFFLGSIYVNYGVTSIIVTVAYLAFFISGVLADWQRLTLCLIFAVAFPLWFHRYSRAAWLAFDYRWDGARSAPVAASNAKTSG